MSGYKGAKYTDRITESAKAKQAALEKFRARPSPDDPAVLARQATQKAIQDAREIRDAQRRVERAAEAERLAAEERARIVEQEALKAAEAARVADEAAQARILLAQQKAARDARYAARKARR